MEITDQTLSSKIVLEDYNEATASGFSFDNQVRNAMLVKQLGGASSVLPSAWKTGTTIVGIVYKHGVVLGYLQLLLFRQ